MTLHPGTIAARQPDRVAVIIDDRRLTYRALDEASRAIAAMLHSQNAGDGLAVGVVVAMLIGNTPAFFSVAWAAQRSGLYYLPIPTRLTANEIRYIIEDSGARVIIADAAHIDLARQSATGLPVTVHDTADLPVTIGAHPEPAAVEGGDMLYTSGTTGRPKGVRRPLSGEPLGSDDRRVRRARDLFGIDGDTIFLSPAPLYHAAPLRFTMNVLRIGGTVVAMAKFDAAKALRLIAERRITHSQWVPTMFARLLALPAPDLASHDLSHHRVAIHAGAPCAPDIKAAMISWWGPIVHEYYSGTESVGFTHISAPEWLARPGSVGRAHGGQIHIIDGAGRELGAGETGFVYFGGTRGVAYHNDAAKSASANDSRGWATMGDIGHVDADGYLFLTDRQAFTIIAGGVNIYPTEIENALHSHDAVADCAVFGVADADLGEAVFALVELAPDAEAGAALAARLADHLRGRIAGFKVPRRIAFGPVGRTDTGKLMKADLRRLYAAGTAGFATRAFSMEAG